jgi:hypothetical protein
MKLLNRSAKDSQRQRENGQINIFFILMLGIFFIAFLGFAVDFANFWFHRRAAQAAADAACQAGAMDLLVNANTGSTLGGFPSPAANFDCAPPAKGSGKTDYSGTAVCDYAALNGYPSGTLDGKTPGNDVTVSFPGSVTGVAAPPKNLAPTPFIQVNIEDDVQTFFSGLLTGKSVQPVGASATCGLVLANAPIPIIVLNPTCQHSFQVSGSATLQIVGGPSRSVQVNSDNQTCASATDQSAQQCSGSGTINLSKGGPNFNGSTFGSFGPPLAAPSGFSGAGWISPSAPISDPFATLKPPNAPATARGSGPFATVAYHVDGCPDPGGCQEYLPGSYNQPIVISGTAIFVPGVYYINPTSYPNSAKGTCGNPGSGCISKPTGQCHYDFVAAAGSNVRPAGTLTTAAAQAADDGSHGVVFYLSGPGGNTGYGGVFFDAQSGKANGLDTMPKATLSCDGTSDPDPKGDLGIPANIGGNLLVAQCTSSGTYIGSPSTDTIPTNLSKANRGILFFQDRANSDPNGQNNMQGGGGLALSGTIYAHNCTSTPLGTPCKAPPTDYNAFLSFQGTPSGGTFVIGEIITDQLVEAGNGSIAMTLNPNPVFFILKAELLK